MKTKKKLKLDSLSSNELANKEAYLVKGGIIICYCSSFCRLRNEKVSLGLEERTFSFLRSGPGPGPI